MNCDRCGSTMILKKLCDYGGYSWGWKCILCGGILEPTPENSQCLKKVENRNSDGKDRCGEIRDT